MKKILLTAAIIITALLSYAQTGDALRDKLDSIFTFIDKSQIPTGYLKEYGSEMVPLHLFNGLLTDSNQVESLDILRYAYADLATAKIITTLPAMQPLSTFNTSLDTARNQGNSTVAVLFGQYASLIPAALSQNLLSVSNEQFYDVAGRSQSPYLQNNLFAAAATEKYFTDTVKLKWSTALYYSNTSASLLSLSINFNDGNGYQAITTTGISKVYTDSTGSKPVVYKAVFSNGLTLYCHSSITVKVTTGFSARYVDTDPYGITLNINSLPGAAVYSDFQDKLQIRYSINNPTRTNSDPALRKLRKPIIYVEGYDVSGKSGYYVLGQLRGTDLGYNLMDLIKIDNANQENNGEWIRLSNNYDFMHDLDDIAGYDLVFVNYNTMRSIPDNALMLQQVINWVNSQKASISSTEKNVVIGVSMGGLVARYCLANMTKNIGFNSTDTKILITHDSPHQGANVPLGFQYFLYNLAYTKVLGNYIKDKNEDIREFLALNDKISTQQLLKARVTGTSQNNIAVSMNSFLNGANNPYHQMVDLPESQRPYKFVATSQGSQCGKNVFEGSNVSIASQDALFTKFRMFPPTFGKKYWLNTNIKSLPAAGVSTILDYKMEARIAILGIGLGWKTVGEEVHQQNPANFVNWDGTPGGTQSIAARTGGGLSGGLASVSPWWLTPLLSAKAGLSLNIVKDQFSFVNITSALDAPETTPASTIFNYNMFGNANTRVDKFVSQEFYQSTYNIFHTDYTPRNAKWMYNEMENISQPSTCIYECDPAAITYQISGLDILCSPGVYTIANLSSTATVTWSSGSNYTVTPLNSNASQVNISFTNPGIIYLTAAIQTTGTNCYPAFSTSLNKQIIIGAPNANSFTPYITQGDVTTYMSNYCNLITSICTPNGFAKTADPEPNVISPNSYCASGYITDPTANTIIWSMSQTSSGTFHGSYSFNANQFEVKINANYPNEWVILMCTRTNECGPAYSFYKFYVVQPPGGSCGNPPPPPCPTCEPIVEPPVETATLKISVSPNPASGQFNVYLLSAEKNAGIKEIIIKNKMGMPVYHQHFKTKQKNQNINLYNQPTDIYLVAVFDGKEWVTQQLILRH